MSQSPLLRITIPLSVAVILLVSGSHSAWALGNGIEDESYEYPNACAVLGLKFPGDENPRIASGVLIHPQVVLTAGHVIDWFQTIWATPPENVRISFDLDAYAEGATWLTVAGYCVHPLYNGFEGELGLADPHDLGLILLSEPVDPDVIAPASLPWEGMLDDLKNEGLLEFGLENGTPMSVVGYGRGFSFPPPSDVPAERGIRRYGILPCMGMMPNHLHFFGDPEGITIQRGDSGGPTYLQMGDDRVLVGIVSWAGSGAYVGIVHHYRIDTPDALDFIRGALSELECPE